MNYKIRTQSPMVNTILLTYSCFTHLSKAIVVRDGFKEEDALGQFQHYFPDFIWLLRDVLLRIPKDKTTGRQLTPTQYLKNRVLKVSGSDQPTVADKVAEAICAFFPSLKCRMLPPPSDDPEIVEDIESNEHRLAERFNKGVADLVSYIKENVRGKTGLSRQQEANGVMLAMLMDKFIQAINQPGAIPNLDNAWQHVIMQKAESIVADLANEYKEEMDQKVTSLLPMEEEIIDGAENATSLMGIHRSILESKIKSLEEQLQHVVPLGTSIGDKSSVDIRKQLTTILTTKIVEYEDRQLTLQKPDGSTINVMKKVVTGGILFQFSQANYQTSHDYCTKLFDDLYHELNGKIVTCDPNYSFEHFQSDLKQVQMTYSIEAVGPAKWAVQKQMNDQILQQEAQFKKMKGFQKQALEVMQKAQDAATERDKLHSDIAALQTKLASEKAAQEERFQRLKEQTKKDMAALQEENEAKYKQLQDHHRELLDANMNKAAQANATELAELRCRTQMQEEQIQRDIERAREEKEHQEGVLNSWAHGKYDNYIFTQHSNYSNLMILIALESAGKALGKTVGAPLRWARKGWDWLTS